MGIFDLFRKKNTKDSTPLTKKLDDVSKKLDDAIKKIDDAIKISDNWSREREEFDNYFKSIKRPVEESLIWNSKIFKNTICPYCGSKLDKSPLKKTKCPNCHNYIYVRTNLITKEKMLLAEQQLKNLEKEREGIGDKIDAEKTVLSDYNTWIEFKKAREELEKENKNMNEFDILWGILNKQQLEYAKINKWGLFRNSRYGMYAILNAEKRFKDALVMALEVCYYDINGPNNISTTDHKFLKDFPPFDPESAIVAPALVYSIKGLKNKLSLKWEDVKNSFIERASRVRMKIMPVSPQKAWEILYDDLYDGLE